MSTLCDQDIADKAQQLMNGTGMHSLVLKETEGKILSIVIIIIAITLPAFSVVVHGDCWKPYSFWNIWRLKNELGGVLCMNGADIVVGTFLFSTGSFWT